MGTAKRQYQCCPSKGAASWRLRYCGSRRPARSCSASAGPRAISNNRKHACRLRSRPGFARRPRKQRQPGRRPEWTRAFPGTGAADGRAHRGGTEFCLAGSSVSDARDRHRPGDVRHQGGARATPATSYRCGRSACKCECDPSRHDFDTLPAHELGGGPAVAFDRRTSASDAGASGRGSDHSQCRQGSGLEPWRWTAGRRGSSG